MAESSFRLYGLDRQLYGPVSVETLLEWASDGRVLRDTWIHSETDDRWDRAEELDELASAFPRENAQPEAPAAPASAAGDSATGPVASKAGVPVKVLNRLKLFSGLDPANLEPFARAMVEESFRPFSYIVQQGAHGDAMYFVIQGKVGISTKGQLTESFLVALNIGDTFGEMSLFDPGPRSADVRAENDVILLKLTAEALQKIRTEAPAAATAFLWNVARLLSARMRSMDKRAASARDLDAAGKGIR